MNGAARRFPPVSLTLAISFVGVQLALAFAPLAQQLWVFDTFAVFPDRFGPGGQHAFTHWYDAFAPLIGHAFLHGGWLHLAMNTLVFLQAAPIVEQRLGPWRMLALFIISAVAGAGAYIVLNPGSEMPAVGASGAVCGVFAAYFLAVRNDWRSALAEPQIRNAAVMFLLVNVGLAAVARMTGFIPIAWEAHLGGFIGGALAYPLLAPPPRRAGPWG